MKVPSILTILGSLFLTGMLQAQAPAAPLIEPVVEVTADQPPSLPAPTVTEADINAAAAAPEAPAIEPVPAPPQPGDAGAASPAPGAAPATEGATPFGPLEAQKQEMQQSDKGFIIKDAGLNDIFQFLAKSAGRQYFHNSKIVGPEFLVTGHLNDGNPLQQMEELAFMYGLSLHTKGSTIYALTQSQLAQLPSAEFHYQLRYLRPTDMEQIKELIKPMLSPGTGIVNFEPKTNTIIIIDSAHRIEQARELLHGIDKAKGQIIVETKILRVNSTAAQRTGVNWSSSLGKSGTTLSLSQDLNELFGLDTLVGGGTDGGSSGSGSGLVLGPFQVSAVLRALAEGNLARQVSNPTLITEDNEQATISIIDRIPIITTTITAASGGAASNPTVTEEVRYKIDTSDPSIDANPEKHREIGISIVVTPTLLPDGTVRMKMRPRSAQIVEQIKSQSGNFYPRVTESMVESIARVPDGYSLVVGGFYGEAQGDDKTKVPGLGDIPILNFFFKSKEATKEHTSLVFIVTPKSYNPTSGAQNQSASNRIRSSTIIDCDHNWVDEENPGPAHEPNLKRTLRDAELRQAPYYPRADELNQAPAKPQYQSEPSSSKSASNKFSRAKR